MATILSLAMKVNADASGVVKNLTPAERALQKLADEASKVTDVFDEFAKGSEAAAAAQRQAATDFAFLSSYLKTGKIDAQQFADEYERLKAASQETADAFARGAEVTRQYRTDEQQRADVVAELTRLLELGAISEETYARAIFQGSDAQKQAVATEQERLQLLGDGQRITQQFLTDEERRATGLQRLDDLLKLGAISQETFNRAAAEASGANKAAAEAEAAAAKARADLVAEAARVTDSVVTEQEKRQASTDRLDTLLRDGLITEETYARAVYAGSEAQAAAAAAERERLDVFARGKALSEQFATAEERRAKQLEEVDRLLKANAISEETAARARAEFSGLNAARIEAEKELAAATEEAANRIAKAESIRSQAIASASRIIEANLTPQERYDQQMQELNAHLQEGRLSQEQFNRAAAKAEQDLNGVAKEATKTDQKIEKLNNNVSLLAKIEIGRLVIDGLQALGSVFSQVSSQITSLVSSVNGSIDTLGDFSARTGIGVEQLQSYSLAAKLAGVDTEQFGSAVQSLAVNIGKSAPGDAFDKSLKGINLSVQELRALSPEQQFSAIGQAISQLPTAADRAAAAVEIFGKQGAALAPLFREGAASIEELQANAERLGIIISETQVNNVADMNDAFDLVAATVQGITGQVIGNLAPAVTDVTNQFLKFVESWSGAQGEGGTGIANAITDVLLQGAQYFAGIFDEFVKNFGSLGETFAFAADVFDVTSKVLLGVSESFRVVFNALQLGIDALIVGFGKILQGLGSFVDSDLEEFGRGLVDAGMESTRRNSEEMEAAAANAANTFNSIFTGGSGNAQAAGQGAASQYLAGLRAEIENARRPEVQLELNLDETEQRLQKFLAEAGDDASQFLQESVAAVDTFQQMAEAGELTADQIEIMNGFMKNVNAELVKEKKNREDAKNAATAQAEADKKRLDQLLGANDEGAKLEQDLQAVQREQARVSEELAAARASDNQAQADAAAARQAELDQLQAKLEEQQQALEQGFGQGFTDAFNAINQNINGLIAKSQEFGQAGFDAAVRLQEGIAAAQQQARDGILNAEAYQQEVQRQQDLFNQELKNIEEAEKARDKAAQDRLDKEKQRQEAELKAQDEYRKQQETALQAYQQQQAEAQKAYAQEQQRIFEEQRKAAAAEAKRQEDRLRKLNTLGQTSVQTSDIRTAEGAALVLNLANAAQDPALIQQRLQTKLLQKISEGIGQAAANYFNTPVAIVGYSQVGGVN